MQSCNKRLAREKLKKQLNYKVKELHSTNLHDHVADGLLSCLREDGLLRGPRGLYDGRKVETDSSVEEAPEETRQEVEQGLADENQGHPLVVRDHVTCLVHVRHGDVEGHVIRVAGERTTIGCHVLQMIIKSNKIPSFIPQGEIPFVMFER